MQEDRLREHLLSQMTFESGTQVLDLGCGTGTLTVMLK